MNFLRYYVRFLNPENNSIFKEELEKLTGRSTTTMGIEELLLDRAKSEGLAEGKAEGEQSKALEIARTLKHLGVPIENIVKATGLSIKEIKVL